MRTITFLVCCARLAAASDQPAGSSICATWQDCRQLATAAAALGDAERFHDLAWRAVQTGPPNDAALLLLLARAQSLSGRPHDALVMLQRLAARGVDIAEAVRGEDFRRVRSLPGWSALGATLHGGDLPAAAPSPPRDASTSPPVVAAETAAAPIAAPTPPAGLREKPDVATPPLPKTKGRAPNSKADSPAPSLAETVAGSVPGLALPAAAAAPIAMAYDRVSRRLVLADDVSDTLKVLSEVSGNAVNLVSRGWAAPYRTSAIAIDATRGDLWAVAATPDRSPAPTTSAVYRLQLISGRLLYSVPAPTDAGNIRFAAVTVSSGTVFLLDADGHRLFELSPGAKTLRVRATLDVVAPTSVTMAPDGVGYVAHRDGIARIDVGRRRSTAVGVNDKVDISNLVWIAQYRNTLLAIQRRPDQTYAALRLRFDRRGRRLTRAEVLGPAASPAATVTGDVFFFVAPQPDGTTMVQRLSLR